MSVKGESVGTKVASRCKHALRRREGANAPIKARAEPPRKADSLLVSSPLFLVDAAALSAKLDARVQVQPALRNAAWW